MNTISNFLNRRICSTICAIGLFSYAASVSAQANPTNSTYFFHFGRVMVGIRTAEVLSELCNERFPVWSKTNSAAYAQWQKKHSAFLGEMEAQFPLIDQYWTKLSPQQQQDMAVGKRVADRMRSNSFSLKPALRQQLSQDTSVPLMQACEGYAAMLDSPPLMLENQFASEMKLIRQGLDQNYPNK